MMAAVLSIAKNGPMDAPDVLTFLHDLISIPTLLLTLKSPNVFIIRIHIPAHSIKANSPVCPSAESSHS